MKYREAAYANKTKHWHGLSQSTLPFSDGSPQASQWPIPPRHFFDYELRPQAHEAGTYFYHSHVGFQSITAHGPLIVNDLDGPPYEYDDEITLSTGDFYNETDAEIEAGLVASPQIWTGEPTAYMINGMSGTAPTRLKPASDPSCRPYLINVLPDTIYRIRMIGVTAISLLSIAFEDHCNLTVIETDGSYVQPVDTDHIQVDTGQRFSLLFQTKTVAELQSLGNRTQFWVQIVNPEASNNVTSWAVLNYRFPENTSDTVLRIPDSPFLPVPMPPNKWLEYTFKNLNIPGYGTPPTLSDVTRRVTITSLQLVNPGTNGQQVEELNGVYWSDEAPLGPSTQVPYLVNIYLKGQAAIPDYKLALQHGGWDPTLNAWPALMGEVLEIVWLNAADQETGIWGNHPMHAHGGQYWDVGSGEGTYDPKANEAKMQEAGYVGSRRDTTMLYRYGYATNNVGAPREVNGWRAWRLRIDNPGVWMMHCHILQHIIMGMSTAWVFGNASDIVQDQFDLTGYLTYGGNAYGNSTTSPVVLEH